MDVKIKTDLEQIYQEVTQLLDSLNQEQKSLDRDLQDFVEEGFNQLTLQALIVNSISYQLIQEIIYFHRIAKKVNQAYHQLQKLSYSKEEQQTSYKCKQKIANVWELHHRSVPKIIKRGSQYILTSESIEPLIYNQPEKVSRQAEVAQLRRRSLENWLVKQKKDSD